MIEIRRILFPTDFSDSSRRLLEHASAMARWYEAEVTLLHVVPLWPPLGDFPPYVNPITLEPTTREQLCRELRAFGEPLAAAGIPLQFQVVDGDPTDRILKQAQALGAHVLVMGTHGRRGFERWALGSVTERVLRMAPCPVLTGALPEAGPGPASGSVPFKRILCGLDFQPPATRALDYALSLAQEADARLTLLHVLEWPETDEPRSHRRFSVEEYRRFLEQEARDRLRAAVPQDARNWCEPEETVTAGKAYQEILRVAQERDVELIVLGVHGRGRLDLMLFGSTTNRVVREARCPVLAIRSA